MSLENFETIPEVVSETQEEPKLGGFQNPNYLTNPEAVMIAIHDVGEDQGLTAADLEAVRVAGDAGSDLQRLANEVQEAQNDLYDAEARLQEAMDRGGSVLTLMSTVESCRNILETRMRMYNEALVSATAAPLGTKEGASNDEVKFGSVSHKQWELEQAIKSGNSIAIEHKRRDLAHEIAKEEAKKLQK